MQDVPPASPFELSMSPRAIRKRERKAAVREARIRGVSALCVADPPRPSVVRTQLSAREQYLLRQQTDALFEEGKLDLRFMGMHFLELHHLNWTPPFLEHHAVTEDMSDEFCAEWTDEQFDVVFEWWRHLHYSDREKIIECSRTAP